jgi:DNA polymerase
VLLVTPKGIKLPNGLYITYPRLKLDTSESRPQYVYKSRRGEISVWGGVVTENVVQALARIIVGEQMIHINDKYRPLLTVHDAVVCVAADGEEEEAKKFIMGIMSTAPEWAKGLPITCESGSGDNYGDC